MWHFVSPHVLFGEDSLDDLGGVALPGPAVLVSDAGVVKAGLAERVRKALEAPDRNVTVFADVAGEPDLPTVERCLAVLRRTGARTVVAVGGGSAMDCAKAACALYARPDLTLDAVTPFEKLGVREKVRLITVPTTSGTGADATWAIVVTDPVDGRKLALANRELVAEYSILDPSLVAGLPPALTAGTGFDALTHAIEGYTCRWRNDFTDPLCVAAAETVLAYLPRAVKDGEDKEARTKLHNAATLAGLGFGNSQVGAVHSIGHAVGAVFHVHHGTALAVALPHVLRFNAAEPKAARRYADLARRIGLADATAEGLIRAVTELRAAVGLAASYRALGVAEKDWAARMDDLVRFAANDPCTVTNPRTLSEADFRGLLDVCYAGRRS